mgnify:CR=1 FL=1|jgi:hypothetical protein
MGKCQIFFIFIFSFILLSQFSFAGRYYDSRTGRFLQIDPKAGKYPNLSPYTYCADNPLKYIDPNGKELTKVTQGNMNVICDKKIAANVSGFLKAIQDNKLPLTINNSFRTTAEQKTLYDKSNSNTNPVAKPGTSRHESGFAIDFNGVGNLTKEQKETLDKISKENKFSPLEGDTPHYESDPKDAGYKDRTAAIDENQKDYTNKNGSIPDYSEDKKDTQSPKPEQTEVKKEEKKDETK